MEKIFFRKRYGLLLLMQIPWIYNLLWEVNSMKRGLIGLVLCVCLSLTALFGGINAKTIHGGIAAGPQCDLPAVRNDQ